VLRAIWQCSIEPVCNVGSIDPERYLACHLDQMRVYLAVPNC
jgi:hypothetical protein